MLTIISIGLLAFVPDSTLSSSMATAPLAAITSFAPECGTHDEDVICLLDQGVQGKERRSRAKRDEIDEIRKMLAQGDFDGAEKASAILISPIGNFTRSEVYYQRFEAQYREFRLEHNRDPGTNELPTLYLKRALESIAYAMGPMGLPWEGEWERCKKEGWSIASLDPYVAGPGSPDADQPIWVNNIGAMISDHKPWLAMRYLEAIPAGVYSAPGPSLQYNVLCCRLVRYQCVIGVLGDGAWRSMKGAAEMLEFNATRAQSVDPGVRASAFSEAGQCFLSAAHACASAFPDHHQHPEVESLARGAERCFRRAVENEAGLMAAYTGLAYSLLFRNAADEAERMLAVQIDAQPHQADLLVAAALVAALRGKQDVSRRLVGQAVTASADGSVVWIDFANRLNAFGLAADACHAWESAASLKQGDPEIWTNLAFRLRDLNKTSEAIDAWRNAIKAGKSDAVTLTLIGDALMDVGRFLEARDSLMAAIELDRNHPAPWRSLRLLLERCSARELGDQGTPEAITALMGDKPCWPALGELGFYYGVRGEPEMAAGFFAKAYAARTQELSSAEKSAAGGMRASEVDRYLHEVAERIGEEWPKLAAELAVVAPGRTRVFEARSEAERKRENAAFQQMIQWIGKQPTRSSAGISLNSGVSLATEAALDAMREYRHTMASRGYAW